MENVIISDTEFIDRFFSDGTEEHNLIYGILYHSSKNDDVKDLYIYNLLATLVVNKPTKVLRTAKIKYWKRLLILVISKLKSFEKSPCVTVPFCNLLCYDIQEILHNYELAFDILTEFENNVDDIELIDDINDAYPVPTMSEMFIDLIADYDSDPDYAGWVEAFEDEMIRRHLYDSVGLSKSPDYDKNVYHEFVYENDNKVVILEKESCGVTYQDVKVSDVKRIGVLYYMLKDALKSDQELLVKVANFVIGKDYTTKTKANNSAYKYIHCPDNLINKSDKIEYIKKQLERYGIEVPEELE